MKPRLQLSVSGGIKRMAFACARRRGKSVSALLAEHFLALDEHDRTYGYPPDPKKLAAKPRHGK